jgi:hypothetical protein
MGGKTHMNLRPALMPPVLDEPLIVRLAKLADRIDGARPGQWEKDLAEFNRLAGTEKPFSDFQGIYGGDDHENWVRRIFYRRSIRPDQNLSEAEMAEVVTRVMAWGKDHEFFLELFLVNCKHPSGSDLIFWPSLVPEFSQNRQPTVGEIAHLAIQRIA